ncbi:MAG TPA: hypothetical protein VFD94_07635 [Jatrophihabitans sp.]|nr:hypothetical protein [Jatrophihabitans sp.]
MTALRRWLAVLAGIGLLLALPSVVGALPATRSTLSAATLLTRIQQSGQVGYSGYAESTGGLALPVTSQFTALSDLFGGNTQLRVWWRSELDWRVDSIGIAGETDTHTEELGAWTWNYESNTATFTEQTFPPAVRLPTDADLLPPQLGRRLLSQATAAEASRLPSARVAGLSAAGLRIVPADPRSSIDHVDVWADPDTGLPLRVRAVGKGSGTAAISTSFLDVRLGAPPAQRTAFSIPAGANLQIGPSQDLATTIDRLGGGAPPASLAGIARNALLPTLGSIGVYGRGVTEFAAVPLPPRIGYSLHHQLAPAAGTQTVPGVATDPDGDSLQLMLNAGPLNLLLTPADFPGGPWLLVGTVSADTLTRAAGELPRLPR